jgi:hypothetical protein
MKTLKSEKVYLWDYQSVEDVKRRIPYFLQEVYNQKRLHSAPISIDVGYRSGLVDCEELSNHDKASLDIVWRRDKSLEESDNLPDPDVLAQEIVEDLEAALEQSRESPRILLPTCLQRKNER